MNSVKRVIAIVLILIIGLGASGCMMGDLGVERYSAKMRQMALDYMRDKYDEEFTFSESSQTVEFFPGTTAYYTMHSESHPEWSIMVEHDGKKGHDNYVAFLVNADLSEVLRPYIEQVYEGEYRLFADPPKPTTKPDNLGKNTTAEEYLRAVSTSYCLILTQGSEQRNLDAEKLWNVVAMEEYATITLHIYYVTEEYMQSEGLQEWRSTADIEWEWCGVLFSIGGAGGYKEPEWREGPV